MIHDSRVAETVRRRWRLVIPAREEIGLATGRIEGDPTLKRAMKPFSLSANLRAAWFCGWVMVVHCSASAADPGYKEPDPSIIASVGSTAASLTVAPSKKPRRVLVYGISFGPHRFSIRTAEQVFTLLGKKTGAYDAVVSDDLASFRPDG